MADPSVVINLAAEFTGNKAFKQADTATQKLDKSVTNLAKGLLAAFSIKAVVAFGKASIKAAAADQKAQSQLALALKNVGLGREAASAEGYIQRLQSEFGVVDDKLRPAYQQLAVATRNTAETQKLLGLALDISASTGKDLQGVTSALSKAYLGNNTALSKLGVGISKVDLKTKSFKDITDELSVTFAGSATAAASGYQGSIDKLAVASENFKESIGTGLIESLKILSGDQGLGAATSAFDNYGKKISDATVGTAYLSAELKKIPGASLALNLLGDPLGINTLLNALQKYKQEPRPFKTPMTISGVVEIKTQTKVTALTKAQAAAALAVTKAKKDQLALDKAAIALGKGKDVFDMESIQLNAAMISTTQQLGKVTTQTQLLALTNDLARLRVKQDMLDLEAAIAAGDAAAATAAAARLNKDLVILGTLNNQALKLADIKGILAQIAPKSLIDISNLDDAIRKIKEMLALQGTTVLTQGATSGAVTGGGNNTVVSKGGNSIVSEIVSVIENMGASLFNNVWPEDLPNKRNLNLGASGDTVLNFNAPIYTVSDQEFAANVQKAIQNANRFGNNLDYAGGLGN